MTQPFLFGEGWMEVRDGNDAVRQLLDGHYSRAKSAKKAGSRRGAELLVLGPGDKLVLISACGRAAFGWRRFINDDGQSGVNCAFFRNEGTGLSSDLIRRASTIADRRWPGERQYTYVDPEAVRSTNPGYCFLMAGWRRVGVTKINEYAILEREAPTWC